MFNLLWMARASVLEDMAVKLLFEGHGDVSHVKGVWGRVFPAGGIAGAKARRQERNWKKSRPWSPMNLFTF